MTAVSGSRRGVIILLRMSSASSSEASAEPPAEAFLKRPMASSSFPARSIIRPRRHAA